MMKLYVMLLSTTLAFSVVEAAVAASAKDSATRVAVSAKVAVVNFEEIVNFDDPSKSAALEWADRMAALEIELRPKIAKIQDKENLLKAKYQKAQAENSQDEDLKAELMRMKQDIEIDANKYKAVSTKRFEEERGRFGEKIQKVVQELGAEQGWTHVLPGPLLYVAPSCDITKDVTERMNKEFRAEKRAKSFVKPGAAHGDAKKSASGLTV